MTKQELREYRLIRRELQQLRESREYFYSKAERSTRSPSRAPAFGGDHDPLPDIIDKVDAVEAVIRPKEAALAQLSVRIERIIDSLPITERVIMRARYTEGRYFKGWVAVAMSLGLSESHVKRIHGNILEKIRNDTR